MGMTWQRLLESKLNRHNLTIGQVSGVGLNYKSITVTDYNNEVKFVLNGANYKECHLLADGELILHGYYTKTNKDA